jgi:endonuclease/exonuclease/phosphatase family metal-dependent hydrolase
MGLHTAFAETSGRRILVLLWIFVHFGPASPHLIMAQEPRMTIRVLSYNIHHSEGVDRKLDVERIATVIRSVKPDLVALQEVDQKVGRTDRVDQPQLLSEKTGLGVVFGKNIALQGGHYGNAFLSRFPVTRSQNHLLPNLDQGEQRGVLEAEVELPGTAGPLVVLTTHFDHRPAEAERLASAQAIQKLVEANKDRPTLLAGDLNATPDSDTLSKVFEVWTSANSEARPTVPVGKPLRQIDYILFRPQNRWRVVEVRVLEESVASDHRAIFAVLELLPKD